MTIASFLSNRSFSSAVVTRRAPSAGGGAVAGATGATGDVLALFHSAELQAVKTPIAKNERIRRIDKPPNQPYQQLVRGNKYSRPNFLCLSAFVNAASSVSNDGGLNAFVFFASLR